MKAFKKLNIQRFAPEELYLYVFVRIIWNDNNNIYNLRPKNDVVASLVDSVNGEDLTPYIYSDSKEFYIYDDGQELYEAVAESYWPNSWLEDMKNGESFWVGENVIGTWELETHSGAIFNAIPTVPGYKGEITDYEFISDGGYQHADCYTITYTSIYPTQEEEYDNTEKLGLRFKKDNFIPNIQYGTNTRDKIYKIIYKGQTLWINSTLTSQKYLIQYREEGQEKMSRILCTMEELKEKINQISNSANSNTLIVSIKEVL